jgi:2-keto-4-pentenoate hydratase
MTTVALTSDQSSAARMLAQARRDGQRLPELPEAGRPASLGEALAMQRAVTAELGETVGGWKVGVEKGGGVVFGEMYATRIVPSPARIEAARVPLLGLEVEVAFRFEQDLPVREKPYEAAELAALVVALPVIEVVDSRYADYRTAPNLDRVADSVSFGMLVTGTPEPRWREMDFAQALGEIRVDGELLSSGRGNAKTGDPLLPALALANAFRTEGRIKAGHIITTGTYSPLRFGKPGQRVLATIEGLQPVQVEAV